MTDLLKKLNDSPSTSDLSEYSPVCIASVFKKFLRELPDPLIPVQKYDQFLEAASKLLKRDIYFLSDGFLDTNSSTKQPNSN